MDSRMKVGIIAEYYKQWIGGVYYYQNILHAFQKLRDEQKPCVVILSRERKLFEYLQEATQYPYLKFYKINTKTPIWVKFINKICFLLLKKNLLTPSLSPKVVDCIIGLTSTNFDKYIEKIPIKFYWIPDFQEHYLPYFFSSEEIKSRKIMQTELAYSNKNIVLSSHSAFENFKQIYPGYSANVYVIPFAITVPAVDENEYALVRRKYQLPEHYFYCPNQFWQHKNHVIVLRALIKAVKKGTPFYVVFSGYTEDYRNKAYFSEIQQFIQENKLVDYVRILGFIDRREQLLILKHSKALIQPSKFEGWSSTIEEAKAFSKPILSSDIPVHREQLKEFAYYFNPDDEETLINAIEQLNNDTTKKIYPYPYQEVIENYAMQWIDNINKAVSYK